MSMQQNPSWAQRLGLRLLVCMDPGICISSDTAIAAPGTTRTELLPQGRNHFARKPPKGKRQKAVGRVVRKPQSKGGRGTHHLRRMERKVFMRDGGVAVSPGGPFKADRRSVEDVAAPAGQAQEGAEAILEEGE